MAGRDKDKWRSKQTVLQRKRTVEKSCVTKAMLEKAMRTRCSERRALIGAAEGGNAVQTRTKRSRHQTTVNKTRYVLSVHFLAFLHC